VSVVAGGDVVAFAEGLGYIAAMSRKMVNLGCGGRFHQAWLNYDLVPQDASIRKANFFQRVPLADGEADVVYHSHVLEHLTYDGGRAFLKDCARVLKPGGTLRIVVPDLEAFARDYVAAVDRRRAGESFRQQHQWSTIELVDQLVRVRRGGEMRRFLDTFDMSDKAAVSYVRSRLGSMSWMIDQRVDGAPTVNTSQGKLEKLQAFLSRRGYWGGLIGTMFFRSIGENHQWMWDEFSLGDVLGEFSLVDIKRHEHNTSSIEEWGSFGLDTNPDGTPHKGVSVYLEARKR
jgi:predicted SAM-dependent methyltransferase